MRRPARPPVAAALAALGALAAPALAQQGAQAIDSAYTAQIRALTPTHPRYTFTTDLVDYLPASATVPSPLAVLGYVPGTLGRLSHVADVNRYFRALDAASPRVRVFSLGTSDEGREELVAAIGDEAVLARVDEIRAAHARLADPRGLSRAERDRLVRETPPIYWVLGAIHSPETGSPEMLLELAYRLAVDEGEQVQAIRRNVLTLLTPVQEVDGRDRMVDLYRQAQRLQVGQAGMNLVYWGKYTAHDNNRDGMVVSQQITQNYLRGFLHWHPMITHDLHESVPFLYTSTGTGPYNDQFDAIQVNEWHQLAYQEINELTRRGLPGVWTHGFYDGWAPNYMLAISNFHNSLGRFYETYTSGGAGCQTVNLGEAQTQKEWFRSNPAVNGVKWCIRSNINYQQSGVMIALKYVGDHRETFLENYAAKAERQTAKGRTQAPYAFVIPRAQRHAAEAADLVNLLRLTATEIHEAADSFTVQTMPRVVEDRGVTAARGPGALAPLVVRPGDWIVRLDQPYTQLPRTLFATQTYKPEDPAPYDDTGWTLDELRHVVTHTVADSAVLTRPMRALAADARVEGTVAGAGPTLLVPHLGDWRSAVLPWKAGGAGNGVRVADSAFTAGGATFPAGSFIVESPRAAEAVKALGLEGVAVASAPSVRSHAIALPRIAYVHTWQETQNEGWVRFALDQMGVPYTYMSDQKLRAPGALDRYDVVVFPHSGQGGMALVNGRPMAGPAVPWQASRETPHLASGTRRPTCGRAWARRRVLAAPLRRARRAAAGRGLDDALRDRDGARAAGHRGAAADARRPRRDLPRPAGRDGEPDPLRLRRPPHLPGLLQPDAAPSGRRRGRRGAPQRRHRHGGRVAGRRGRARAHAPARGAALPRAGRLAARQRDAAERPGARRPSGDRRRTGGEGARAPVRDPAVLAAADAGVVGAGAQRDGALERARRDGGAGGDGGALRWAL
jgi:hypothetical protein